MAGWRIRGCRDWRGVNTKDMGSRSSVRPLASVVIPAHNEAAVVIRCLDLLRVGVLAGELDVIVVANGCTDETADIARDAGVRVVETPIAGKRHALLLGDAQCQTFPRVYLDADVELAGTSVRAMVAALDGPGVMACAPTVEWDLTGVGWLVKRVHKVHDQLIGPYRALAGVGVYMLTKSGHERAFPLPEVVSDDEWVHRSFRESERVVVPAARCVVRPARTVRAHLRRRVRVRLGNRQLARLGRPPVMGRLRLRALGTLVSRGGLSLLDAAAYLLITGLDRFLGTVAKYRAPDQLWGTDSTSRKVGNDGSQPIID